MFIAVPATPTTATELSPTRLHLMRAGYLLILAVIPWRYVWRTYVRAPGDRWR